MAVRIFKITYIAHSICFCERMNLSLFTVQRRFLRAGDYKEDSPFFTHHLITSGVGVAVD